MLSTSTIEEMAENLIISKLSTYLLNFFDILEQQIIEIIGIHT